MGRPISLGPSKNPAIRHATRLLSMVHELHKASYQRIRFSSGMSPSGVHWRCLITHAGNIADDSLSLKEHGDASIVARYSSASGDSYFDWTDAPGCSARELAARFIERFPEIARMGDGLDWAYAGWLTDVLGNAELTGALPVFFADYPIEITNPPPPPQRAS
jgi:hypothetical protein